MRVAFIINDLSGGGAERVVSTLARIYARQGHDVELILLHGGVSAYDLPSKVRVHALEARRILVGPGRLLFLPLASLELTRLLRRIRPDAAISFLVRANLAHLLTRRFGNSRPIFISERTIPDIYYKLSSGGRLLKFLTRRLYPHANRIVAISDRVKHGLIEMGIPAELIVTIYNPHDPGTLAPRTSNPKSRRGLEHFLVGMMGRLSPEKDYPTMLHALHILVHERGRRVRLLVLGDGPERQKLEALAKKLSVADSVTWAGWLPAPHPHIAQCDAFALTSLFEGFGNVLVEAMAYGLPVISTACGGPTEILSNGAFGRLVNVGDSGAIASHIEALMDDPILYKKWCDRAVAGVGRYDAKTISEAYLSLISPHQ